MTDARAVAVLGATSFVGQFLLDVLRAAGRPVLAVSRAPRADVVGAVRWLKAADLLVQVPQVAEWVSLMPIEAVTGYLPVFEQAGVRRLVALSTTSVFTKGNSPDARERAAIERIRAVEEGLMEWARGADVECVVLRPTMVYGAGLDHNVARIGRFIERFGFFPLVGRGQGLRQPVHAADVAAACLSALTAPGVGGRFLTLSGAEVLSYAEMVRRVARARGRQPMLLPCPIWGFRMALVLGRLLPNLRGLNAAMAARMTTDMVFPHDEARALLGFDPRPFEVD